MENQFGNSAKEGLYYFELSEFYKSTLNDIDEFEKIDVNFEEEVDLDKVINTIDSNELDKIFKEIKSTIVN